MKAKDFNLRKFYVCKYQDNDLEFCTLHTNQIDARKSITRFKRKFGVIGDIESKKIRFTKKGFVELFNEFCIKYKKK